MGKHRVPSHLRNLPGRQPLHPHDVRTARQKVQNMRGTLHSLRLASGHQGPLETRRDLQILRTSQERMSSLHLRPGVRTASGRAGQGLARRGRHDRQSLLTHQRAGERCQPELVQRAAATHDCQWTARPQAQPKGPSQTAVHGQDGAALRKEPGQAM